MRGPLNTALRAKLAVFKGRSILDLTKGGSGSEEFAEVVGLCRLVGRKHWREIIEANQDIGAQLTEIEHAADSDSLNAAAWRDLLPSLEDNPHNVGQQPSEVN